MILLAPFSFHRDIQWHFQLVFNHYRSFISSVATRWLFSATTCRVKVGQHRSKNHINVCVVGGKVTPSLFWRWTYFGVKINIRMTAKDLVKSLEGTGPKNICIHSAVQSCMDIISRQTHTRRSLLCPSPFDTPFKAQLLWLAWRPLRHGSAGPAQLTVMGLCHLNPKVSMTPSKPQGHHQMWVHQWRPYSKNEALHNDLSFWRNTSEFTI